MNTSIFKPSLRTIKTGLAVALSLAIARFFHLEAPFLSAISALFTVNVSISGSYKTALYRMTATLLAAVIASIFLSFGFHNSIAIGIGIIVLIQIFIKLKWQQSIITAGIMLISIMLFDPAVNDSYILFSLSKVIDTFIGVVTGFLVNFLLFPPRREKVLVEKYRKLLKEFIDKLGELLEKEGDVHISPLVAELNAITDETLTIEADHHFIKHRLNESEIWEINILFYKLFSFITQLIDKQQIVPLSDKNLKSLEQLLKRNIEQRFEDKDENYEKVFNATISRIIMTAEKIEERLKEIEGSIEKKHPKQNA